MPNSRLVSNQFERHDEKTDASRPPVNDRPAVKTCVFCGASGQLTREHVLGDWLSRTGLDLSPVTTRVGPLNQIGRSFGTTPPFRQTVKDVCSGCNGGWLSRLEDVARRVLTPLLRGKPGTITHPDCRTLAAWVQKTASITMLMSSEEDREAGYGLPPAEYRDFYARRETSAPLPDTHVWIGRYDGPNRTGSISVVPQVVKVSDMDEPHVPQGYAMTIVLGEVVLFGLRLTTPMLRLPLLSKRGLALLWPENGDVSWPEGVAVDGAAYLGFSNGTDVQVEVPNVVLGPWRAATDFPASRALGSMVELSLACGEHIAYYPSVLVSEAAEGRFYAFVTSCECPLGYLIETEADGAHCKAAGSYALVVERYGAAEGDEYVFEDEIGQFFCKEI